MNFPWCFSERVLVGPFYDRLRGRCCKCGARSEDIRPEVEQLPPVS